MPLIIPANTLDTGYSVANSCRFNDGDSAYMAKTGTAGNRKTWTFSCWIKRGALGTQQHILQTYPSGLGYARINFTSADDLQVDGNDASSGNAFDLKTNRLFRDCSAWYSIVIAFDSTQGTAANRLKIYINGTQETSFATSTYPAENVDYMVNDDEEHNIGRHNAGSLYFDGYLAEVVLIDGTAYAVTSFGEFNEDSPTIWQPIDVSGLTFGNNGFYLDFEASDNLGNDANGGTDLTETNLAATDQTTDTPTNNFCTLNPLDVGVTTTNTYSEGNTEMIGNNTTNRRYGSTFAVSSGKWYVEAKQLGSVTAGGSMVGIFDINQTHTQSTSSWGYHFLGTLIQTSAGYVRIYNGSWTTDNYGDAGAVGDILMLALDLDNNYFYVGKNGTWVNSGDPTSAGTGDVSPGGSNVTYALAGKTFMFGGAVQNTDYHQWNFGNPSYANSSDAADANGYGAFEFAPPSGYFALCTKNLAEFG